MRNRRFAAVFLYVLAANFPYWIAAHYFGLVLKGWFNLEFFLVGILSLFLRRWITAALLLGAMLVDVLSGISMTYMLSGSEVLRSSGSLLEVAPSHLGGIVILLLAAIATCFGVRALPGIDASDRERRHIAFALLLVTGICATIDLATGQAAMFKPDRQLGSTRMSRWPMHYFYEAELRRRSMAGLSSAGRGARVPAASMKIADFDSGIEAARAVQPNLVLVLVESWGMPLEPEMESSLTRSYSNPDLLEKYTVSKGIVPFYGATVDGEARELCGSEIGFGLLTASASRLTTCLPDRMKALGYHTMGVHGFSAQMFGRVDWYRTIGFDEVRFRDQFESQGLSLCPGPFPGICDAAIASWIGDRLQKSAGSPQFIYWVTLNSHLPVPIPNRVKTPPSCSEIREAAESHTLCSWYQLEFNVHRSVVESALRETARPTVWVIVGDHAPPFSQPALRAQFSDQVVPYMMLLPKEHEPKAPQATRALLAATHSGKEAHEPHPKRGKALPL